MEHKVKLAENIKIDKKPVKELMKLTKKSEEEIVEKKDIASPLQKQQNLPTIMNDLEVPSAVRGPFSTIDRERWITVIEALMTRGVKSTREAAKITGLTHMTCSNFINEIKDTWQNDLTPEKVNYRREVLYSENERIAEFCWGMIQMDPTDKNVPSFLKIIGETNTRRSRLVGAEQITLAVGKIESNNIDTNVIQTKAAAKLGVSVNALKEMGDIMATKMLPSLDIEESDEENDETTNSNSENKD